MSEPLQFGILLMCGNPVLLTTPYMVVEYTP
jgi:hypothetical protein